MPPDDNTAQDPQPLSTNPGPPPVTPPPPAAPLPPQPAQPVVPPVQNPAPPPVQPTPNFAPSPPSGGKKKLFIILGLVLLLLLAAGAVLAYIMTRPPQTQTTTAPISSTTANPENDFDAQYQALITKAKDCTPSESIISYNGPSPIFFGAEFQITSKQSSEIKKGEGAQCILSTRYLEYSTLVSASSISKAIQADPNFAKNQGFENMTAEEIATKLNTDNQKTSDFMLKSETVCTFDSGQHLSDYLDSGYKLLKGESGGTITTSPKGGNCVVNDI